MSMTSLRNEFVSSEVNKFFNLNGRVTVNATLLFLENSYTSSVIVKRDIQRKIIEVIQVCYQDFILKGIRQEFCQNLSNYSITMP